LRPGSGPASLSPSELLEVSMIASVAGEIRDGAPAARRLFRARSPISMARKKSARLHLAGAQSHRALAEDLRRAA